jgi:hypothetical protein
MSFSKGDGGRRSDNLRPGTGVLGANGDDKCDEGGEMDGAGARGVVWSDVGDSSFTLVQN